MARHRLSLSSQPMWRENHGCHETGAGVASQSEHTQPAEAHVLPCTTEITLNVVNLKAFRNVLKAHFLLFVNCGGQPQCIEMIPIFKKYQYIRLLIFKRSDKFSQTLKVDNFAVDGINYNLRHFRQANCDLIKRGMQMTQSQHSKIASVVSTLPSLSLTVARHRLSLSSQPMWRES